MDVTNSDSILLQNDHMGIFQTSSILLYVVHSLTNRGFQIFLYVDVITMDAAA